MSWFEQAQKKLKDEAGNITGQKEAAMKGAVQSALLSFADQNEEFARAVVQGDSFVECMKRVAQGVGSSISDLEAYRKAVAFYFPEAKVSMVMKIELGESANDVAQSNASNIALDVWDFL